jgi:hypothetical protein
MEQTSCKGGTEGLVMEHEDCQTQTSRHNLFYLDGVRPSEGSWLYRFLGRNLPH